MILRIPLPVYDVDDSGKLRARFDYYTKRPADAAALIQREQQQAQALRQAREDRLRASWIYGEDQPDV